MKEKPRGEHAEVAETLRLGWTPSDGLKRLTERIIGCAIEVHRHVGPGLLESAYEECLCYELSLAEIRFRRQVHIPVQYKKLKLDCSYRLDLLVEDEVIVEIKAVEQILRVHPAQLLTYLKATNKQVGLLINFQVAVLKDGIQRLANHYVDSSAARDVSASSAYEPDEHDVPDSSRTPLRFSPRLGVSAGEGRPR